MGVLDYSRGAFVGKVGVHYGQKSIGSRQLKKIPLKAAKQNATQTASVRAFERLNRFASAIVKIGWQFLALSDKKMMKHNAAAAFFKPLIKNHFFDLNNFSEFAEQDYSVEITKFDRSADAATYTIEANVAAPIDKAHGKAWFVFVFDARGRAVYAEAPETYSISRVIPVSPQLLESFSAFACRVERVPGRARWLGWDLRGGALIAGGRWYFANSENPFGYEISGNKVLLLDPASVVSLGMACVR